MQDIESSLWLFDCNEFLRPLLEWLVWPVLEVVDGCMRIVTHQGSADEGRTLRTFSGFICGGGGILGNCLWVSERGATRWRAMYLSRPVSQAVLETNVLSLRDLNSGRRSHSDFTSQSWRFPGRVAPDPMSHDD